MRKLIEEFPKQIADAVRIGGEANLQSCDRDIKNVLVIGLGGSGIGGKIVSQLLRDLSHAPITLVNSYNIPAFVDESTLVVVSSYSGNTEETLSALEEADAKNAEIAVITSGGRILEIAKERNYNFICISGGNPPRSQVGYSIIQQLFILEHYGIIEEGYTLQLDGIAEFLQNEQEEIISYTQELSKRFENKTPIIYSGSQLEGVCIRLRQQLNENSKRLCWHHVFPELNHNELVGWEGGDDSFLVILMRSSFDHARTSVRMDISKPLIEERGAVIEEWQAKGVTEIEQVMYLIHLGDWLSLQLAEQTDTDPMTIKSIDHLKSALAEVK